MEKIEKIKNSFYEIPNGIDTVRVKEKAMQLGLYCCFKAWGVNKHAMHLEGTQAKIDMLINYLNKIE